jgi:hypothetical protein
MRNAIMVLCALAALPALAAAAPVPTKPDLGPVKIRLWYEETGRLSAPVDAKFSPWNTIIGEGSAEESANDLFVTVEVLTHGQAENVDLPLVLEARDAKGRVVATRTVKHVFTSGKGRAAKGLWLYDVGCAGPLTFTAKMGTVKRQAKLDMACGE